MKAFAKKVRVAVIMVGLLTVVAATTNLSGARAEDVKRSPPACGFSVSDDEWGRNMPEYGWIHNYVVWKKTQSAVEKDDCSSVLDDEWGRNMPEYGWIHNYVVNKKKECEARRGSY